MDTLPLVPLQLALKVEASELLAANSTYTLLFSEEIASGVEKENERVWLALNCSPKNERPPPDTPLRSIRLTES